MAKAISGLYKKGEEDETMTAVSLFSKQSNAPIGTFGDGDHVIFYNIRGEREIELTESLTDPDFGAFPVEKIKLNLVTMIQYDPRLNTKVAFPRSGAVRNTLSEMVSQAGLSQVKIAESEKQVHVEYFLNGKNNDAFSGEERIIIPSPKVHEFDSVPQMKAAEVGEQVIDRLSQQRHDLIIANLCNIDVVGHSENIPAIKEAIETVDLQVGRMVDAARSKDVRILITADHGTVEDYYYPEGKINTGHTISDVPFIYIDEDKGAVKESITLRQNGSLIDVAPTVLSLLRVEKPNEMTGNSLLKGGIPKDRKPVLLIILDGWGHRHEVRGNLIHQTNTPNMDLLTEKYPFTALKAAGETVGMPTGTVGNSEAGHLHIGAGRIVLSDRKKIDNSIEDGSFFENQAFNRAMEGAKRDGKSLHFLGIVSFYSSHGSLNHLFALMDMAKEKGVRTLYIHSMLGRRGERPESGAHYIEEVEKRAEQIGLGQVVSVIGRKWAMDREQNWDRVEKTYRLFLYGEGVKVPKVEAPKM